MEPAPTFPDFPATTASIATFPEVAITTVSTAINCVPNSVSNKSPLFTVPLPYTVRTPFAFVASFLMMFLR